MVLSNSDRHKFVTRVYYRVDCEQSLSFPNVSGAIEPATCG